MSGISTMSPQFQDYFPLMWLLECNMFFNLFNFVCMKCFPACGGGGNTSSHVTTTNVASPMCIPAPQKWTLHRNGLSNSSAHRPKRNRHSTLPSANHSKEAEPPLHQGQHSTPDRPKWNRHSTQPAANNLTEAKQPLHQGQHSYSNTALQNRPNRQAKQALNTASGSHANHST